MDIRRLLPGNQLAYWDGYEAMVESNQGVRGSFVADTSQDPSARPRCGAWFPSVCRNNIPRSVTRRATFTKRDVDMAMGFPSLPFEGCKAYEACFPSFCCELPRHQYGQLCGNGIHCALAFTYWSFVFSHCLRRADVEKFAPPISCPDVEASEAEDDTALACAASFG